MPDSREIPGDAPPAGEPEACGCRKSLWLPWAAHPASLTEEEKEKVLEVLDSDRFADKAPAQAWAVLLDEGCYYCSIRTMYRILESRDEVRERRAQAAHPARVRPELVADGPDQVWTWDITF